MAKKSFKRGLGSLIQDSRIEFEDNGIVKEDSRGDKFKTKIVQLQDELMLWRTGKLTLKIFEKSLKENNLIYKAESNSFEKLK